MRAPNCAVLVWLALAACEGRRSGEDAECDDCEAPDCAATPEAAGCPCESASPVACYDGPVELAGVGACRPGLRACEDGAWTECTDQVLPRAEAPQGHDDVDDDCNGVADDGLCEGAPDCGGVCCGAGEACLGTYCDPGRACITDDECDDDTHCVGRACRPWGDGESDPSCVDEEGDGRRPDPVGELVAELQCEWTGDDTLHDVLGVPVVADLDGGGLDGVYDPEIVFIAVAEDGRDNPVWSPGTLVVIEGDDCTERFRSDAQPLSAGTTVAIGDLDGDARPEIVAAKHDGGLVGVDDSGIAVLDAFGGLLWESGLVHCGGTGPVLANLNARGAPEIVCFGDGSGEDEGATAFDWEADVIWRARLETDEDADVWSYDGTVADVDLDGVQEVVLGDRILDAMTGESEVELEGVRAGGVAVADFDPSSPEPEIAVVGYMRDVRVQTIAGDVVFGPFDEQSEAPPTAADFDADGQVELGVLARRPDAGEPRYVVFDPDCDATWDRGGACGTGRDDGVLWEKPIQTEAATSTAGTVFDLDGDGVPEVVFNDACFLHLYDGRTGETRVSISNSDGGVFHYPVVADVDGDAHAEIVVPANGIVGLEGHEGQCQADPDTGTPYDGPRAGVRVFRDPGDRWMSARPIWNQHGYSVTNVEPDGTIPVVAERNWEVPGLNDYRKNSGEDALVATRGIDLTVRGEDAVDACPDHLTLRASVANRGTVRAPAGMRVTFTIDATLAEGGAVACETTTPEDLYPGDAVSVSCEWREPGQLVHDVWVHVDDRSASAECHEGNNDAWLPAVRCEGID